MTDLDLKVIRQRIAVRMETRDDAQELADEVVRLRSVLADAVDLEREACATLVEIAADQGRIDLVALAARIRARGGKP